MNRQSTVGWMILIGAVVALQASARPIVIKNEDNEHVFMCPKQVEVSERGLIDYVDFMTHGQALTHLFFCACGQRASFDSSAWEPIWYGMDEKDYDGGTNTHPWKASAKWFHDNGIDPYRVMVRRARENGVSPWMSMRMNDIHFVTSDKLSRTTSFWRNHPKFRIYPDEKAMGSKRPWTDFTLDFAHKEVRDYSFAMARELLTRYDCDGLELDFLRCIPCLRYEHAEEDAHFLTEFVRRVKKAADRTATDRDHPVGLAVRVPQNLRCAHQLGMEVETWVEERLVDIVVLSGESTANFELDYQKMASALKAKNPNLIVVPMIDRIQCNDESFPQHIDLAGYRGWADAMYAKGVDGLYLFNLEYSNLEAQRGVYAGAITPEGAAKGYRRYFTTCDDVANKILKPKEKSFLPVGIDKAVEIPVRTGRSRPSARVEVVFGFDGEDVPAAALAPKLNGKEATGCEEVRETGQYCGAKRWIFKRSLKVCRWSYPLEAFVPGVNTIAFAPVGGAKARIIWSELALDREERTTE